MPTRYTQSDRDKLKLKATEQRGYGVISQKDYDMIMLALNNDNCTVKYNGGDRNGKIYYRWEVEFYKELE